MGNLSETDLDALRRSILIVRARGDARRLQIEGMM